MELKKIIVASGNKHKIEEIKSIFNDVEIISMHDAGFNDDIEETGDSFKQNAYIKAKAVCDALNAPTLADDSGLCVDVLDGAPGIYSARFSGEGDAGNRALLLKRMNGLSHRKAHFECAVCLAMPDGKTYFGEGRTFGKIMFEEIGDNGFGYDPLFYSDDLKKSFGVATEDEKNSVSHRYRALQDLRSKI
jgi:XTP/dITP diphosphohydrolase